MWFRSGAAPSANRASVLVVCPLGRKSRGLLVSKRRTQPLKLYVQSASRWVSSFQNSILIGLILSRVTTFARSKNCLTDENGRLVSSCRSAHTRIRVERLPIWATPERSFSVLNFTLVVTALNFVPSMVTVVRLGVATFSP